MCVAISALLMATSADALTNVYSDNFEDYPVGTSLIDGTNFWFASDTNVIVQDAEVAPGGSTKAAMIPIDATLSNRFNQIDTPSNVWLNLQIKPVRYSNTTNYPQVDTNVAALFFIDSNGCFVAYDGNASQWITITQTVYGTTVSEIPSNSWVTNLNIFVDYSNKSWQIAIGTELLSNNIGFINPNISNLNGFDVYNGGGITTYLDNVSINDQAVYAGFMLQPAKLTNWGTRGLTAKAQTFDILGGRDVIPLSYTIVTNDSATWLSVNPGSGTLSNGCTNAVTVNYISAPLAPGTYNSSLSVRTGDGIGCTQRVDVTLNVADIAFSTNEFVLGCMHGWAPPAQSFDIVSGEASAPGFVITTNVDVNWMTVSPGTGTLTDGTHTINLAFRTNGLATGVHTAILDVVMATEMILTQQIAVVVTALEPPVPEISWTNIDQVMHKGIQPPATNLLIRNIAAAPRSGMRFDTASDSPAWLSATPSGLCTNDESQAIAVQFADMTATSGVFCGTLTIHTVDTNINTAYTPVGQISSTLYASVSITIIGIGTPTNLTASDGTDTNGIQLLWAAATNVHQYEVWRASTNIISLASKIGVTASNVTAYYDTSVNPGLTQWYWVRAINSYGGIGNFSEPDSGWRFLPPPTDLTASSGTYTNRVALNWTGSPGAVNYEIWRSIYTNIGLATRLGSVSAGVTSYDDITCDALVIYYYWVRSQTPDHYQDSSMAAGYRAALLQPHSISASKGTFNSKIRVIWSAVDSAIEYEVWRSPDSNLVNAMRLNTVSSSGYDDSQAVASQFFYYYWIRARNAQGYVSPFSEADYGWLQLATPVNVSATQGTRPYSVRISWNAVENATSYEVVRAPGSVMSALAQSLAKATPLAIGAPGLIDGTVMLGEATETFWDDNATFAGAQYLYNVRARSALGTSEYSSEVIGWRQVRQAITSGKIANDYDGDKLADLVLVNTDHGLWRILCTTIGEISGLFGDSTCVPVNGDYDGDGLADLMAYSATHGSWHGALSASSYAPIHGYFGGPGQLPAVADYDHDGLMDFAVFDPATGNFTALLSGRAYAPMALTFGSTAGFLPVPADFDGDGKADPAIYSGSTGWLRIKLSSLKYVEAPVQLGRTGVIVVPADFDGDGISEISIYNEAAGTLSIYLSSANYELVEVPIGGPGYAFVVPADYDGDGLTDPAVYSQTQGWLIMFSSAGYAIQEDTFRGINNLPFVP